MADRFHLRAWKPLPLILLGLALTACALVLHATRPPFLHRQELLVYDVLLRWTHHGHAADEPVAIVDLDEATLRDFGQWPWPRYRVARLLERIQDQAPRAVALDMVFAEPDAGSLANWQGGLARELGLDVQVRGLPPGQADFDALLGSTLARGSFVLGYKFQLPPEQGSRDCLLHPLPLILRREPGAPARPDLFAATGATCNLPVLARAAGASGFFNIVPDPDGVIRRMPLLMTCGDQVYPCLPLALLAKAEGASQAILELDAAGPRSLRVGRHEIPVDPRGDLLIHFRGRGGGFEYVSAGSLLRGTVPPGQLKGRFVLVGTSAAGLRELRATPLDGAFNGVEVHATVLDNLLRGDFLAQPASAWAWEALAILVAGLVSSLAFARFGARLSGVLAVLSILALLGGGACLLAGRGLFLQPLLALLTVAGNFGLLTWWKSRTEERALGLRTQELLQTQDLTIHSMAALGEARDPETGAHLRRTQHYVRVLALKLRENPKYRRQIDDDFVEALSKMAPLHDIGKIGIPDRILLKPEGLTEEEFEVMKSHTLVAGRIFEEARAEFGPNSFLVVAEEVCRGHHEKWDGSGYPLGLKGEEIPLAARIMALADVYDAAVSPRVYKDSIAPDVVAATLAAKSGTHFDPGIVVAFLAIQDDFARIAERYRR